jgi:NitT/TauT family transport system substrate-binding protein
MTRVHRPVRLGLRTWWLDNRTHAPRPSGWRRSVLALGGATLIGVMASCGSAAVSTGGAATAQSSGPVTLRMGYRLNLTDTPDLVGVSNGYFARALGSNVTLKPQTFNAGPDEITAMFGGALDMAFVGPSPVINGFIKSHGQALRIVAGDVLGGAELVVSPAAGISTASDLRGKRIATPQLGNTQDVALRVYLAANGIHTTVQGGGDATIVNADNSTIVTLFQQRQIDAAWVPEPYASKIVDEAGGKVLVNEASLWPNGKFPTTMLVASTSFLQAHPDVVSHFLKGLLDAMQWINANPDQGKTAVNNALLALAAKPLLHNTLNDAWSHLDFSIDPLASAMTTEAKHFVQAGFATSVDLHGIFDLRLLNKVLQQESLPTVSDAGLGPTS